MIIIYVTIKKKKLCSLILCKVSHYDYGVDILDIYNWVGTGIKSNGFAEYSTGSIGSINSQQSRVYTIYIQNHEDSVCHQNHNGQPLKEKHVIFAHVC